jgi:hypothetical protein
MDWKLETLSRAERLRIGQIRGYEEGAKKG